MDKRHGLVFFDSEADCIKAVKVAQEQNIFVQYSGALSALSQDVVTTPRPCCIFIGTMVEGLVFMQNGGQHLHQF